MVQAAHEVRSHPARGAWIETEVEQTLQSQEKGASRDKDILLFDLMGLFIIGINEHNFSFFLY